MWHVDLGVLVEGLDHWSETDENIARLVDREDYWLRAEYASWTTDPDDPEVKRAREERRRRGIKPPPEPLLMPVALRPHKLQTDLIKQTQEKVKQAQDTHEKTQKISIKELRELRGK